MMPFYSQLASGMALPAQDGQGNLVRNVRQGDPNQAFKGLLQPQGEDLSGGGFGAQIGDINSLLHAIQRGGFQTKGLDLSTLMQLYSGFLGGAEQRQAGQLGQQGLAQGYSMGLQNPGLLAQRYRNQAYENFANQYGQAGMYLPQLAFQSQLQANQANIGNLLSLLGLRGQGLAQQQQLESQKGSFGSSLGGFLGGVAGSFGGPLLGAAGTNVGSKLFK